MGAESGIVSPELPWCPRNCPELRNSRPELFEVLCPRNYHRNYQMTAELGWSWAAIRYFVEESDKIIDAVSGIYERGSQEWH